MTDFVQTDRAVYMLDVLTSMTTGVVNECISNGAKGLLDAPKTDADFARQKELVEAVVESKVREMAGV